MLDKEAIEALREEQAIANAHAAVRESAATQRIVMLPSDFQQHDLEKFQPHRRRARGTMSTTSLAAFAAYAKNHAEAGATVFINAADMSATAVLNLGSPDAPGHADNRAKLEPKATAAYKALVKIANGGGMKQGDVAEFLEDWAGQVECFNADGAISPPRAIAAVRKITIEALRKLESEEQSLSASRSAFESVAATSKEPLPTTIYFKCQPYADLDERTFVLRLGVLTTNDKPLVNLRIVKQEEHQEDMANELASKIADAFDGEVPNVLGTYSASA